MQCRVSRDKADLGKTRHPPAFEQQKCFAIGQEVPSEGVRGSFAGRGCQARIGAATRAGDIWKTG
jgi:hypothetical protein